MVKSRDDEKPVAPSAPESRKVITEHFDIKNAEHIGMYRPLIVRWSFP